MSNEKYDVHVQNERRTAIKKSEERRLIYWGTVIAGILVAALLAFSGNSITGIIWLLGVAGGIYYFFWVKKGSQTTVQCRKCGSQTPLQQVWSCGWCNHQNNAQLLDPTAMENCSADGCGKLQNAIKCPACREDIILDLKSYNAQQEYGEVRPGVASFTG